MIRSGAGGGVSESTAGAACIVGGACAAPASGAGPPALATTAESAAVGSGAGRFQNIGATEITRINAIAINGLRSFTSSSQVREPGHNHPDARDGSGRPV